MKANRVCSPLMRAAPFSCTLALALFLGSIHGMAQPGILPWSTVHDTGRGVFERAIRVRGTWVAFGSRGRISTIRNGVITNIATPLQGWNSIWAAETGEIFVTSQGETSYAGRKPSFVGMRAANGTWRLWKQECSSLTGLSGNAVWADTSFWDGAEWKPVSGLGEGHYRTEVFRVGKKTYLRNGELTWQLNRNQATRTPTLDKFSQLGGSGDAPEWGIRNREIFRFVGNRWVHFAQAPTDAKIVTEGSETLFVTDRDVAHVKGGKLVSLGSPTKARYAIDYVGVAVEGGTVLALTSWGQELRLIEGQTPVASAAHERTSAVSHGAPISASQCMGSIWQQYAGTVQTGEESEDKRRQDTAKWRRIFTRGAEQYAVVNEEGGFLGIERFDGKAWSTLIGPEVVVPWRHLPDIVAGGPEPDSELWLAGCGYINDYVKGQFIRHTLPDEPCPDGFLQSSTESFFYASIRYSRKKSVILRRAGGGWVSEPTPANHIDGMCEREGQIYAIGEIKVGSEEEETETKLLLRRAAGYFSNATSKGDWNSGLTEEEFGAFDGVSGASTDGYLLVGDRIEHFDGKSWSEFFTDSGLGLTAIAQSQGWVLGLGKDGFVYQRDSTTKGNHFLRQQHLNATSLIVESPMDATVANGKSIIHWNGQSWTEQKGPARDGKKWEIVGFARLQGKLRAFESNGQVLSLEDGVWKRLSKADPITHIPGPIELRQDDDHEPRPSDLQPVSIDELPRGTFKPCVAFQPRAEVAVLLSCDSHYAATFNAGHWTSVPLPYNLDSARYGTERKATTTSGCVEDGACYVFGNGSVVLKAERSAL